MRKKLFLSAGEVPVIFFFVFGIFSRAKREEMGEQRLLERAEADIPVRSRRVSIQVEREDPIVRPIVGITTANKFGTSPRLDIGVS